MNHICKICGNNKGNELFIVKERRFNRGDAFQYMLCGKCGTFQLLDDIADMGKWYPKDDYSPWKLERYVKKYSAFNKIMHITLMCMIQNIQFPQLIAEKLWRKFNGYMIMNGMRQIKKDDAILDVGCGSGGWLFDMQRCGFKNLTGLDLYAPKQNGAKDITWIQGDIFDKALSQYQLITFHHSFEHMTHPFEILKRAKELLAQDGEIIIRIPVMGGGSMGYVWS